MTSTELMPVVMIIPLLSYVLTDLSGHCERELFFILFVVMAETEGPIQEFQGLESQIGHNHFFNVSDPHTCCYDAKLSEELSFQM